jgi:hypothetical protein
LAVRTDRTAAESACDWIVQRPAFGLATITYVVSVPVALDGGELSEVTDRGETAVLTREGGLGGAAPRAVRGSICARAVAM